MSPASNPKHSRQDCHLSLAHVRENTLLLSWRNCIGCHWDTESITKSCPWRRNATKVQRRNTCRNSFPDRFLHDRFLHDRFLNDPFAHHRTTSVDLLESREYRYIKAMNNNNNSKCCWKIHQSGFSLFHLCSQAVECPTTTSNQGSRHLGCVPQRLKKHLICEWLCTMCLFLLLFIWMIMAFSLLPAFSALNIQVNGILRYKSGHHHHQRCEPVWPWGKALG